MINYCDMILYGLMNDANQSYVNELIVTIGVSKNIYKCIRARCLCLDRGRRQLDLGRSPSPLRLLGTVSRLIFVIPGSLSGLSGVDSSRIFSIPLVIYLLSCPLDSYFCILIVCELLAVFVTIFKKPNLIIIIIIIIIMV